MQLKQQTKWDLWFGCHDNLLGSSSSRSKNKYPKSQPLKVGQGPCLEQTKYFSEAACFWQLCRQNFISHALTIPPAMQAGPWLMVHNLKITPQIVLEILLNQHVTVTMLLICIIQKCLYLQSEKRYSRKENTIQFYLPHNMLFQITVQWKPNSNLFKISHLHCAPSCLGHETKHKETDSLSIECNMILSPLESLHTYLLLLCFVSSKKEEKFQLLWQP